VINSSLSSLFFPQVTREQMFIEFDYTLHVNTTSYPTLHSQIVNTSSAIEAATGAHAIAVLTEWDEFAAYDYRKIYDVMSKPAFVFDGRNILNHAMLREIGFEVYAIGKTQNKTF
jgi:UDPglucose 6-dehydrogenase